MAKLSYFSDDDNTQLEFAKVSLETLPIVTDECLEYDNASLDKKKPEGLVEPRPASPAKCINTEPTVRPADEPSFLFNTEPTVPRKSRPKPRGLTADSELFSRSAESARLFVHERLAKSPTSFEAEQAPQKCADKPCGSPFDQELLPIRPAESSTSLSMEQKGARKCRTTSPAIITNIRPETKPQGELQVPALEPILLLQNPEELLGTDQVRRMPLESSTLLDITGLQPPPARSHGNLGAPQIPNSFDITQLNSLVVKETKALCQFTDLPTLLPILRSRQLVTGDEFVYLHNRWEQGIRTTTVGVLLEVLQRKHPNWAFLLLESLREEEEHKGHEYLVGLIEEAIQKKKLQVPEHASYIIMWLTRIA